MKITKISQLTGNTNTMDIPVDKDKYEQWENSDKLPLIQRVFPELLAEHREFLLTGSTLEEWNEAFSEEDDYIDEIEPERGDPF